MAKKIKKILPRVAFNKLEQLYAQMEEAYNQCAEKIGLTCQGCPDNCCTSFFQHHTYIEWAYFWKGLNQCPEEMKNRIIKRAKNYVQKARENLDQGIRPDIMCPVNEDGLCILYKHRLMICRMHGVPNSLTRPDKQTLSFPGCYRCQELCNGLKDYPVLDRTNFYTRLADLEMAFVGPKIKNMPRVNLTLAEMIVLGPPKLVAR